MRPWSSTKAPAEMRWFTRAVSNGRTDSCFSCRDPVRCNYGYGSGIFTADPARRTRCPPDPAIERSPRALHEPSRQEHEVSGLPLREHHPRGRNGGGSCRPWEQTSLGRREWGRDHPQRRWDLSLGSGPSPRGGRPPRRRSCAPRIRPKRRPRTAPKPPPPAQRTVRSAGSHSASAARPRRQVAVSEPTRGRWERGDTKPLVPVVPWYGLAANGSVPALRASAA